MYSYLKSIATAKDVAEKNGIKTNSRGKALCPFHADKKPSMTFKGNVFNCFACGAKGDMFILVSKMYGVTNSEARTIIMEQFNMKNPPTKERKKIINKVSKQRTEKEKAEELLLKLEIMYADTWKHTQYVKPLLGEEIDEIVIDMASFLVELRAKIYKAEADLYYIRKELD